MGDIFLHVLFARRLRTSSGLHPLVVEAIVRRPNYVALGAALPLLPQLERARAPFFKRLFGIGAGESTKWTSKLDAGAGTLRSLAAAVADGPSGLPRLALVVGLVSHDALTRALAPALANVDAAQRPAIARAQARLWMQTAVPSRKDLVAEWAVLKSLAEPDVVRRAAEVLEQAMKHDFRETPPREALLRWARALAHQADQVDQNGLPPSLGVSDHDARASHFDGEAAFVRRTDEAAARLALGLGRLAEAFEGKTPTAEELRTLVASIATATDGPPSMGEVDEQGKKARERIGGLREAALSRGRNPKAAYHDDARPTMPPLPEDSGENQAFRAPAHTQEISAADVEGALSDDAPPPTLPNAASSSAPLQTQEISAVEVVDAAPAAPKVTQQISLADIAEEMVAADEGRKGSANPFDAPSSTQQVSLDDIEAELAANEQPTSPKPPAHTQQISLADIEAEMVESTDGPGGDGDASSSKADQAPSTTSSVPSKENGAHAPPPAPAHTQQISAADIEAELVEQSKSDDEPKT